jgi:hypothetical protein
VVGLVNMAMNHLVLVPWSGVSYKVDRNDMPVIITASLVTLFVNRFSSWLFPLVRQLFCVPVSLISLWISEHSVSPPA